MSRWTHSICVPCWNARNPGSGSGGGEVKRKTCECPIYCKYCGSRLRRDWIGHFCPTKNCQWQHGVKGCEPSGEGEKR